MNAAQIIADCLADGVTLKVTETGGIKATGLQSVVDKWLAVIRLNKPEILQELKQKPCARALKKVPKQPKDKISSYEEYLSAKRDNGDTKDAELVRISSLKTIATEIAASEHLDAWLKQHAGNINVITDESAAIIAIQRLKANGDVIGLDIETAKALEYMEHPQAGLHPKVSKIRLVQLFQSKASGVIIIDCFLAGCIPVYYGAPDIEKFVPKDVYIDYRKFTNFHELNDYLRTFSEEDAKKMLSAARNFLQSKDFDKHYLKYFVGNILDKVDKYPS